MKNAVFLFPCHTITISTFIIIAIIELEEEKRSLYVVTLPNSYGSKNHPQITCIYDHYGLGKKLRNIKYHKSKFSKCVAVGIPLILGVYGDMQIEL